tara:strand:- start:71 stop:898 length:828 start_codon:yes stop_codon:yes gene_type:complete
MRSKKLNQKYKLSIIGATGRMGQMLVRAAQEVRDFQLVGLLEVKGHSLIGTKSYNLFKDLKENLIISDSLEKILKVSDVVIDFTNPENSVIVAEQAAKFKVVDVIGTTGFSKNQLKKIEIASKKTTIIRAGNMSLGVNILTGIAEKIAEALDSDFDVEIIEMHHNNKVDAPSGTAIMLGDSIAKAKGYTLDNLKDSQREGIIGPRKKGKIGFSVIRGGDIVGSHSVIFAGLGEQITIKHNATDRMIFARGALKAAKWGITAEKGEYSMLDVLKLN